MFGRFLSAPSNNLERNQEQDYHIQKGQDGTTSSRDDGGDRDYVVMGNIKNQKMESEYNTSIPDAVESFPLCGRKLTYENVPVIVKKAEQHELVFDNTIYQHQHPAIKKEEDEIELKKASSFVTTSSSPSILQQHLQQSLRSRSQEDEDEETISITHGAESVIPEEVLSISPAELSESILVDLSGLSNEENNEKRVSSQISTRQHSYGCNRSSGLVKVESVRAEEYDEEGNNIDDNMSYLSDTDNLFKVYTRKEEEYFHSNNNFLYDGPPAPLSVVKHILKDSLKIQPIKFETNDQQPQVEAKMKKDEKKWIKEIQDEADEEFLEWSRKLICYTICIFLLIGAIFMIPVFTKHFASEQQQDPMSDTATSPPITIVYTFPVKEFVAPSHSVGERDSMSFFELENKNETTVSPVRSPVSITDSNSKSGSTILSVKVPNVLFNGEKDIGREVDKTPTSALIIEDCVVNLALISYEEKVGTLNKTNVEAGEVFNEERLINDSTSDNWISVGNMAMTFLFSVFLVTIGMVNRIRTTKPNLSSISKSIDGGSLDRLEHYNFKMFKDLLLFHVSSQNNQTILQRNGRTPRKVGSSPAFVNAFGKFDEMNLAAYHKLSKGDLVLLLSYFSCSETFKKNQSKKDKYLLQNTLVEQYYETLIALSKNELALILLVKGCIDYPTYQTKKKEMVKLVLELGF